MLVPQDDSTGIISAWVVGYAIGEASEVWMVRQFSRFSHLCATFLFWETSRLDCWGSIVSKAIKIPYTPKPHEGPGRWWHRARHAHNLNFFGTVGKEQRFLVQLAEKERPKVILAHFGQIGLRVLPVARKMGIPLVVHFHGLDLSSSLRNRWYRWSLRAGLPHFAACIVVGTRQRQLLIEMGVPESRIHVIPCGVPTEEFTPKPRVAGAGPLRFLCVSRLMEFKGVRESILAFARVLESGLVAELVIVGEGEEREALEKLVQELKIEGMVFFQGTLPTDKVREWLQNSDIFLQHSLEGRNGSIEGFGVSVAEAAAVGLPVVGTRCGGILDQVVDGETGFLVEQRDIDGMACAMQELARDPELRRRLGMAGRERTVAQYDTDKQVRQVEKVLMEAAKQ